MGVDVKQIGQKVVQESSYIREISQEMGKVIIGQKVMINRLLLSLISNGHLLLEGVPGLAKSLSVSTLARCIQGRFHRIQFTPDLLPSDLIGTLVFNPRDGEFRVRKGPIFANIILADEINRAPSKVQSALLEAMQEKQVSIGDETFRLEEPFLVLATQNPIEQEGTYPLPEAQIDRFMFKVVLDYPTREEERSILDAAASGTFGEASIKALIQPSDLTRLRGLVKEVFVDERLRDYIVDLVWATRDVKKYGLGELEGLIDFGAGPRATLMLCAAAQGCAFIDGRGYVTPQDIKEIAIDVLRHRIIPSYEAEAQDKSSAQIAQHVLDTIQVP